MVSIILIRVSILFSILLTFDVLFMSYLNILFQTIKHLKIDD